MITDLWTAALHPSNHRPHPAIAALLYAFCPTAAYWYHAGAIPRPPFHPAWQVLLHQAQEPDKTFKARLTEWGLAALEPDLQTYVRTVIAFRRNYPPVPAPETSPVFHFTIPAERRFGLQHPINEHFAGRWEYLLEYVRVWAFAIPDWLNQLQIPQDAGVKLAFLPIAPGGSLPAFEYPFWVWSAENSPLAVTLLAAPDLFNPFHQALLSEAVRPLALKHQARAALLEPQGTLRSPNSLLSPESFRSWMTQFATLARRGPYPPLRAAQGRTACAPCAFTHLCYLDQSLNPQLVAFSTLSLR